MSQQPFSSNGGFVTPGNVNASIYTSEPNEAVNVQALFDDGSIGSKLLLDPNNTFTQLTGYSNQDSNSWTTSDWATGVYTTQGGGTIGAVEFTGATTIIDFVNSLPNPEYVFIQVNGGPLLPFGGSSGGATNITFYTDVLPGTDPTTVTDFAYYYSVYTSIEIDYDTQVLNITANDADIEIFTGGAGTDISINAARGLGLTGNGSVDIRNNSSTDSINIVTDNNNVSYAWTYGNTGILTLPGEGVIQSNDDTIILQSKDTGTGNVYGLRVGTNGGLYFANTEYPNGWLDITNNAGNASISSPMSSGGAAGHNLTITAGTTDQGVFTDLPGGDLNFIGGTGGFNDNGIGGAGGDVNITAGAPGEPGNVAGNVTVNAGTNTWNFDNTGNLSLPGNTFSVNYANGTPVSIGGGGSSYGDANVSAYLASGNNTAGYSTLGNVQIGATGGNTTALAYSSTPTQVTLSWDDLLDPFPFAAGDTVLVSGIVLPDPEDLNGFWTVDSIGAKSITFNTTADPGTSTFDFSTVIVTEYTIGTLSVTGDVSANNIGNVAAVDLNGNTNTVLSGGGTWINSTITWAQLRNKDNIDAPTEIALGLLAGNAQGTSTVAIGTLAGGTAQGDYSVAVGVDSGGTSQGISSVAVGAQAGYISQGNTAVAVGAGAGYTGQGANAVAIGTNAGNSSQSINAISIGWLAGAISQGVDTIAIGQQAGNNNQNANSVAIGAFAGTGFQAGNSVAVGTSAGSFNQGISATSVGGYAGTYNQANGAVALGGSAGFSNQGINAVAVGYQAGNAFQGNSSIAIGTGAATTNQGLQSIALGVGAGDNAQGNNAIAIGAFAGNATQPANSIMLNASGTALNGTNAGFYVNPVRANTSSVSNAVFYNTGSNELTYATTKASTIAGSNTVVTLDNITAQVGGTPTRLYISTVAGNLTVAGDSQTMTSGSMAVSSWINVPIGPGSANAFAMSGALTQNGDTAILSLIDQGTGTGMWRITGMIANTTANTYGVTIERLV